MIVAILCILFVMYFLSAFAWGQFVVYIREAIKADTTFVQVMCIIGAIFFFISAFFMTLLSVAGTVVAIQNGFYL